MFRKLLYPLVIIVIALVFINSCKHEELDLHNYPSVCFQNQIFPIFNNNCASCHNQESSNGFDFTTYEGILEGIMPGRPFESDLYTVLSDLWGHMMPPDNPLSLEERTLIRLWIEQGALNEECSDSLNIILMSQNGLSIAHHSGQNCMTCHSPTGDAPGWFSIAGVIYDSTKINPYPIATVKLYTQILGAGAHVATINADNEGYFYTTENIDFSQSLYPVVEGTQGEAMYMGQAAASGKCYSCHGVFQENIYIAGSNQPVTNDSICFEQQVLPILMSSCAMSNCHDPASAQDDIILNSYWNVINSDDDDLVVPGNPLASELYEVIVEDDPDKRMPPPPVYMALTQEQIDIIYNWISEGALDLDCSSSGCDTVNVTYSGTIWPIVETNCKGCHSGSNTNAGIHLENYTDVKTIADNNKLLNVIYGTGGLPQMPPTFELSDCNKKQIEIWIENGALND